MFFMDPHKIHFLSNKLSLFDSLLQIIKCFDIFKLETVIKRLWICMYLDYSKPYIHDAELAIILGGSEDRDG